MIVICATFSKSLNPEIIEKSVSHIVIRIRFPFESSFWISVSGCKLTILPDIQSANRIVIISAAHRGEHGQDHDWISCRILAILSDQDWIWIMIFETNWIRTGSGYLFDFYNEISLRVIQDVPNYGGRVFFAVVFIFKKSHNDFVIICCTHHNQ